MAPLDSPINIPSMTDLDHDDLLRGPILRAILAAWSCRPARF